MRCHVVNLAFMIFVKRVILGSSRGFTFFEVPVSMKRRMPSSLRADVLVK
jgi:hypothetical protein